jgi:hypothetical protein
VAKNSGHGRLTRGLFARRNLPVARDEGLLVEQVADETVIYDERTKAAHCLSPLAAVVFEHCDGHTSVNELAALATERIGEPVDEAGVVEALAQLEERELLDVVPDEGFSRRQMIQKSAAATAGVAFSAPLITSIIAPSAAAANSATCAEVLCCPCCAGNLGKDACCTTPSTVNCQCVNASNGQRVGDDGKTIVKGGKFCKTTSTSAPSDDDCVNTIKVPTTWSSTCYPFQASGSACGPC